MGDAFLRAVIEGVAMRDPYVPEAGKVNLWHTDYFHPSKYGSYLSAAVHFATITGLNPLILGARAGGGGARDRTRHRNEAAARGAGGGGAGYDRTGNGGCGPGAAERARLEPR